MQIGIAVATQIGKIEGARKVPQRMKLQHVHDSRLANLISAMIVLIIANGVISHPAMADTLHAQCLSPTPACSDNGTVAPVFDQTPEFTIGSGGNLSAIGTGFDIYLFAFVPDNLDTGFTFNAQIGAQNVANTLVAPVLLSSTDWTSGKLQDFTSSEFDWGNGNAHPIDSILTAQGKGTLFSDPGATGYHVYDYDFGASQASNPIFTVESNVPRGTAFGYIATQGSKNGLPSVALDWPNSDTLAVVPEPGYTGVLLAGIIGLLTAIGQKQQSRAKKY